ncbi:hypothetical protein LSAT2_013176 [Lamellibrachia satsuma]|nr:hypothetical protein LSAT2_013176 [Lamellibrachia satsuma]
MRTSVGTQGDRPNGTAAARIYHSEPCLDGGSPQDPHVAKIYSDYCSKQNKTQSGEERAETNKDVARVFRSFADVSRSTADAEAISPIYAMPHDAITQSDWVLDQSCQQSGVTRSSSHVTPSSLNMVGGRNPYGRGVFMRPSDASQYAHKRPKGDSPRHSGGSRTPVPSQILMYQHLQGRISTLSHPYRVSVLGIEISVI